MTTAPLTGSDKQVAWATEIRTARLAAIDAEIAHHTESWVGEPMPAHVVALMDRYTTLRHHFATEPSAAVLIDSRNAPLDRLVSKHEHVRLTPAWTTAD